jgi:hypothetical protein
MIELIKREERNILKTRLKPLRRSSLINFNIKFKFLFNIIYGKEIIQGVYQRRYPMRVADERAEQDESKENSREIRSFGPNSQEMGKKRYPNGKKAKQEE